MLPHKSLNLGAVVVVALLVCLPLMLAPAEAVPWVLAAIGAAAVGLVLVHVGALLALLLGWLAAASVFGFYYWVKAIPGFFNLTIDRIGLAALVMLFLLALALGQVRFLWPRWVGVLLLGLVGWAAVSAQVAGWTLPAGTAAVPIAPPYYRFFAGFLFPAMLFFMAASAVTHQRQTNTVLWFFALFGLYLTFTGLAEHFAKTGPGAEAWARLVWPAYILDPAVPTHFERVRGPFLNSPDMGLTLVVCLFANLLLMTRVGPARAVLLLAVSLPMPLLIFWTLTRSIWLAFVACLALAIWFWPRFRSLAHVAGCLALAGVIVLTLVLWPRLSSPIRERGGVGDPAPIISRYELTLVSMELARAHPLTGVGLGHFQTAAPESPRMRQFASRASTYGAGAVEHNNFMSMLAETGLPGAALYAAVVFGLLGVSIRLYRRLPTQFGIRNSEFGIPGPTRERIEELAGAPGQAGPPVSPLRPRASARGSSLDRRFVVFFWIAWLAFFIDSMFRLTTSSPFPNGMFLLLGGVIVGLYYRLSAAGQMHSAK